MLRSRGRGVRWRGMNHGSSVLVLLVSDRVASRGAGMCFYSVKLTSRMHRLDQLLLFVLEKGFLVIAEVMCWVGYGEIYLTLMHGWLEPIVYQS